MPLEVWPHQHARHVDSSAHWDVYIRATMMVALGSKRARVAPPRRQWLSRTHIFSDVNAHINGAISAPLGSFLTNATTEERACCPLLQEEEGPWKTRRYEARLVRLCLHKTELLCRGSTVAFVGGITPAIHTRPTDSRSMMIFPAGSRAYLHVDVPAVRVFAVATIAPTFFADRAPRSALETRVLRRIDRWKR